MREASNLARTNSSMRRSRAAVDRIKASATLCRARTALASARSGCSARAWKVNGMAAAKTREKDTVEGVISVSAAATADRATGDDPGDHRPGHGIDQREYLLQFGQWRVGNVDHVFVLDRKTLRVKIVFGLF